MATNWREQTFIGFDTETTGRYPLTAEICELAAVKWRGGKIMDTYQTLLKPSVPMGAEVIGIHGITNEMVEVAPRIETRIAGFHDFIQNAVLVAHHAPFDLGFIAIEFEKVGLALPSDPVLCSSLLSRKLFPESVNHRLQTLIPFFGLHQGAAHRALDDARACLEVGLRCLEKTGSDELEAAFVAQGGPLSWSRFSMRELEKNPHHQILTQAAREQGTVEVVYLSGSVPGTSRRIFPIGVVRSLDGDFVVALDEKDKRQKRYFLTRIASVERVS